MLGPAFEPLQINGMLLRNRIVRTAHGVKLPWSDDGGGQIGYHLARAKGGTAMAIIGIGGVHATNPTAIPTHEDAVIPGLRAIADAVHGDGMKLVQQLWHGGATKPNVTGGPPWSSSPVPNKQTGVVPIAMTKAMIDEIVEAFATAARRVRTAGADGVEIHGANGYLINQFLSRALNLREDDYGGSFENRLRLVEEVLDAVRATVGQDFPVGLRLTSNEFVENGLTPPETAEIARALESRIDYLNVSYGSFYKPDVIVGAMDEKHGYQLEDSAVVTAAVSVPTIVTGRIMTMDLANHVVGSGIGDLVSMVRGLIADPEIVRKSREDRTAEIRPCIGTALCNGTTLAGSFACTVNPSAGYESERPPVEQLPKVDVPRRVLVAGGGPAGMEAARTAAIRGHEVILHEMRRTLGGQVPIAARAPYREDLAAITHWQADELARLGVKVALNSPVEPDVIAALNPDVLVLATGSEPQSRGWQLDRASADLVGMDLPHVYSSWDLLGAGRAVSTGKRALVFDDLGEHDALAVTEELLRRAADVTFVTPFEAMGERILAKVNTTASTLRRIVGGGTTMLPNSHLREIRPDRVTVRCGDRDREVGADSVYFVGFPEPNRDLLDHLDDFHGEVHMLGDAAGFHTMVRAIHDGDAVARAL